MLYAISDHLVPLPPLLLRAWPALRSLRALRLVQYAKGLQDLVTTILLSLPSLANVCSILILIVFIFSVLGMQLFTFLPHGAFITDERNYESFPQAHALIPPSL